jgi:hypothetical protein
MRLKRFLKNSVNRGLLLSTLFSLLLSGCSSSTTPTYHEANIEQSLEDIAKKEYKQDVKVTLLDHTLWIFIPLKDLLTKSDKPEKYVERFAIEQNDAWFEGKDLNVSYGIKVIPEVEKQQEMSYNKETTEAINNIWKVMRRIVFSLDRKKKRQLEFFSLVIADVKNGFVIHEIIHHDDLKKVSYELISWTEFYHRIIQDSIISPEVIGDEHGLSINYRDVSMDEFLTKQIQQRIKTKFQKPEVTETADIDKEIRKIIAYTLKIYNYKDVNMVGLKNAVTGTNLTLNLPSLFEGTPTP